YENSTPLVWSSPRIATPCSSAKTENHEPKRLARDFFSSLLEQILAINLYPVMVQKKRAEAIGAAGYVSRTDIPPSTIMGLPVMKLDRSDRRKRAAWAISSGLAILFRGCRFAMNFRVVGFP